MKLGIGAVSFGPKVRIDLELIRRAEALGFDSTWTAEAYGSDAVTTATWVLAHTSRIKVGTAIMQIPARTPAMAAMTAMTLDQLSGGRFLLGLGPSGPQVVEGWHGVPYGKPLTRTREYITIIRQILAREEPLEFHGSEYEIPVRGAAATGLGKPLKSILHGNPHIPIYTASISPAGLRCAAEVADGVFPMMVDPEKFDVSYLPYLEEGFAKAGGGKSLADFAVVPGVSVIVTDEPEKARMTVKSGMALYIGGMGARDKNFYNDLTKRLGYEEAAVRIQDLFLAGKKAEAAAAVPDALLDAVHLVGPRDRVRDRLAAWKEAGRRGWVHTMNVSTSQPEALELLAEELL
ncbi:MAG TPA: LLM class F420-dependent oxidoreductase [Deltaproteobacteria bacterium]|jgi:F420-dependent oxidoreductase-like protein|nr:LLM class F420-dependent oxidoreductase [Deltaproteobacteria bacterium]